MSSELETLNILKKETELHGEVVLQVEKLSEKHLQAYEAMKKQQYERIEKVTVPVMCTLFSTNKEEIFIKFCRNEPMLTTMSVVKFWLIQKQYKYKNEISAKFAIP